MWVIVWWDVSVLRELHDAVHKEAEEWLESLPAMHRMRIQQHMGNIPTVEQNPLQLQDGPAWSWWLISVLPLDPRAQLSIIAMTSLFDRLTATRRVLTYVQRRGQRQWLGVDWLRSHWVVLVLIGLLLTVLVHSMEDFMSNDPTQVNSTISCSQPHSGQEP